MLIFRSIFIFVIFLTSHVVNANNLIKDLVQDEHLNSLVIHLNEAPYVLTYSLIGEFNDDSEVSPVVYQNVKEPNEIIIDASYPSRGGKFTESFINGMKKKKTFT